MRPKIPLSSYLVEAQPYPTGNPRIRFSIRRQNTVACVSLHKIVGFGLQSFKARLHRRFLPRNSMQFLSRRSCIKFRTGSKLLRYRGDKIAASLRACKLAAILWRFYRRDIAGDFMQLRRDKNCIELRDKNRL